MGGTSSKKHTRVYYQNNQIIKATYTGDNDKNPEIETFDASEITKHPFTFASWSHIKDDPEGRSIEFCILDNKTNGIEECMSLFTKAELEQYSIIKGSEYCDGFFYRPGLIVAPHDVERLRTSVNGVVPGKKCTILYQDYNYNDEDLQRCCFSGTTLKCNDHLTNNYVTSHCNVIMKETCQSKENIYSDKCMTWLMNNHYRKEDVALDTYSNFCAKNFDHPVCNYLCNKARENKDYKSEFCDRALKEWCTNNSFDSRCFCVITPSSIIPEIETYLGPKECWLSNCSSQSESKWLLTDQIDTRKKCNLTSCIINIDQMTLKKNAKAELINDCVSGNKISASEANHIEDENNSTESIIRTPGILFSIENSFLFGSILLLLLLVD